jgi:hypothetical protein
MRIDTEAGAAYFLIGWVEQSRPDRPVGEVLAEAVEQLRRFGYDWTAGPIERDDTA